MQKAGFPAFAVLPELGRSSGVFCSLCGCLTQFHANVTRFVGKKSAYFAGFSAHVLCVGVF
jgi:hypothetical protein